MDKKPILKLRGQTLLELALVLPLLILIWAGIVDLSKALLDRHKITSAAREGARAGSIFTLTDPNDSTPLINFVQTRVQRILNNDNIPNNDIVAINVSLENATVNPPPPGPPNQPIQENLVRVQVIKRFRPLTGLILAPQGIDLGAEVTLPYLSERAAASSGSPPQPSPWGPGLTPQPDPSGPGSTPKPSLSGSGSTSKPSSSGP